MKPDLLSFNLSRCWHCATLFDHTLQTLRTRFENQIFNLLLRWFVCHFVELCLKWGWLSVLVRRWMEDYWCLFVVVAMLIFFFPSKGWDFSFCLFTSHDVGAFACIVFSVGLSDLSHKSRVWLLYCFTCFFMMNMYVPLCMSFDIYCGYLVCESLWKLCLALLSDLV